MNYYYKDSNHASKDFKQRSQEVIKGYIEYLSKLLNAGEKVLIIDQILVAGWHIPNRYLKLAKLGQLNDENLCYPLAKSQDHRAELINFRAVNYPKLFWAQLFKMLWKDGVWCGISQLPKLFYSDSNHLSMAGTELLIPSIRNIIESN